jgi:hypothetical protein
MTTTAAREGRPALVHRRQLQSASTSKRKSQHHCLASETLQLPMVVMQRYRRIMHRQRKARATAGSKDVLRHSQYDVFDVGSRELHRHGKHAEISSAVCRVPGNHANSLAAAGVAHTSATASASASAVTPRSDAMWDTLAASGETNREHPKAVGRTEHVEIQVWNASRRVEAFVPDP